MERGRRGREGEGAKGKTQGKTEKGQRDTDRKIEQKRHLGKAFRLMYSRNDKRNHTRTENVCGVGGDVCVSGGNVCVCACLCACVCACLCV